VNALPHPEITIENFEAGDIDADRFDHEAHVYLGWLYVHEFGIAEAISKFDTALRRLVVLLGANGKYHATLTWFFLLLINERAEPDEPWQVFRHRNEDIVSGSKQLLARYYTNQHLFSDRARERFMLPDKLSNI
jgi:hypothetical protein